MSKWLETNNANVVWNIWEIKLKLTRFFPKSLFWQKPASGNEIFSTRKKKPIDKDDTASVSVSGE